jgi:hypothetical protein
MSDALDRFGAGFVHLQQDEFVAMVGLADDEFDTTQYIIIQRTLQASEQDRALKQDGVHLEVCDQIRSRYGGLRSVCVASDNVTFSFDDAAASDLQVAPQLVVGIGNADIDRGLLKSTLQKVCGEYVPVTQAE